MKTRQVKLCDLTPELAKEWLINNDKEGRDYWESLPLNEILVEAVKDNLSDFGFDNQAVGIVIVEDNKMTKKYEVVMWAYVTVEVEANDIREAINKAESADYTGENKLTFEGQELEHTFSFSDCMETQVYDEQGNELLEGDDY